MFRAEKCCAVAGIQFFFEMLTIDPDRFITIMEVHAGDEKKPAPARNNPRKQRGGQSGTSQSGTYQSETSHSQDDHSGQG